MNGRLASRAADAEALLARFNEASEEALRALDRGDGDALGNALDVREALQREIERAGREVAVVRSRFGSDARGAYAAPRVVNEAVVRYCAPLEELARAAQALQARLESSAAEARSVVLRELALLEHAAGVAARYAPAAAGDAQRLNVVL